MASKVFFLCALACAFQGLNGAYIRASFPQTQTLESNLYKDTMAQFQTMESEYAGVIDQFENVVFSTEMEAPEAEFAGIFDSIMESIEGFDGNDMAQEGVDMEVVRKCVEAEAPNFRKFVENMKEKVADARVQLRQLVIDTFAPYIVKAREALRNLGDVIAQFPMKMWECIKEKNFLKALEVIQKTRLAVTQYASEIANTIREARAKFPIIREKAMQLREELRKEAEAGMKVIREAIHKCIAEGGPKVLLAGAPVSSVDQVSTLVAPVEQVSTLIAPEDAVYEA